MIHFYSRPCGRGDEFFPPARQCHPISTHAPAGGATGGVVDGYVLASISTHAPAGGATVRELLLRRSRPCISTHAPAGGATRAQLDDMMRDAISTHAPAGGATEATTDAISTVYAISTHAPAGGATVYKPYKECRIDISTHAPAGGATLSSLLIARPFPFLLTPLREGRLCLPRFPTAYCYFYSRPCGRGDRARRSLLLRPTISTHAPAGGATLAQAAKCSVWIISTHAPAGGATGGSTRYICSASISTHAPAGGATHLPHDLRQSALISTHAPAGGATSCSRCCSSTDSHFYSRPCGRGDLCLPRRR